MRLSTVWIRNKRTGAKVKINEYEWAGDLGVSKYAGWERVGGETHGEETPKDVTAMRVEAESQHVKKHQQTPQELAKPEEKVEPEEKPEVVAPKPEGLPPKPVVGRSSRRGGRR